MTCQEEFFPHTNKMSREKKCPVCLNDKLEELIDFGSIPKSDYFLSKPDENYPEVNLSFEYCVKCAFIRQKSIKEMHDYTKDERKTEHLSPNYVSEIVEFFLKNRVGKNELIIDIGSNDGSFLDVLYRAGFKNLLGIEPSIASSKICKSKGYNIENAYFNESESRKIKEKYGDAKVVVCRHVLEHIEEPSIFVESMKKLLDNKGMLFVEVPDSSNIIQGLRAYDLWDEHINYFNLNNLTALLNNRGFKIEKSSNKKYTSTKTVLLWGSVDEGLHENEKIHSEDIRACKNFRKNWEDFSRTKRHEICNSKKPIVCLGASHPQTNFIIFSGIGDEIYKLVDDDLNKVKKYALIPKPVPIISTREFLESRFSGTVLKTAFGYEYWMNKVCKSIEGIRIIEPYKAED